MKYIKLFERKFFPVRYKVGDYVLVDVPSSDGEISREYAKIRHLHKNGSTKFQQWNDKIGNIFLGGQNYTVEYSDGDSSLAISSKEETAFSSLEWITRIIRKLTPDEIEQFETEKDAKKYNL